MNMNINIKGPLAYPRWSPERATVSRIRRTAPRMVQYLVAAVLFLLLLYFTRLPLRTTYGTGWIHDPKLQSKDSDTSANGELLCRSLPGAEDVVVVLKTGSTELQDKLPVHFNTTLQCYPHYILFSDYEEDYQGEHIYDALEYVSPDIQETHPDFELWRRLREGGRAVLGSHELSGNSSSEGSKGGKMDNPGWKLDKWKFLPMVNRTLQEYPDKKWYVFVEVDTYVLWQTLLNYLNAWDASKPYYLGGQVMIAKLMFAHGGTGFAISQPAMKSLVELFSENQRYWEQFTHQHWAGDAVLGQALNDTGILLHPAWPIFQGNDIGKMEYALTNPRGLRLWCRPTVSYHHLTPSVVESLWEFEQQWIRKTQGDTSAFLRHKDMFAQYILPRIKEPKLNWDNHADKDQGPAESLKDCREICKKDKACLQYALKPDTIGNLKCLTTSIPNLGEISNVTYSGWMAEKIRRWGDKMQACEDQDWFT